MKNLVLLALGVICLNSVCYDAIAASSYSWIESEATSSITPAAVKGSVDDDGKPDYLSAGKWLTLSLPPDQIPAGGVTISYQFTTDESATFQVWNRLGFEAVRSDFSWRIDNEPWSVVKATDPTTDIDELQTWNPIGWLDMGSSNLTAGLHTLQIKLVGQTDSIGKPASLLYASDALCIYNGTFHPNDQYRPGDMSYQNDQDRAALTNIFQISSTATPQQAATPLTGAWSIARDDESVVSDPSGPIAAPPDSSKLYWKSMTIPGDRDKDVPGWLYAHRYWLRTLVNVPLALANQSFVLHFPSINMTATVFVNGVCCGFCDTPFAGWDCDISRAIKPGQTNEISVGIKDWFYALPDHGAKDGGHIEYIPTDWVTKYGPARFTFPVWNHTENGILQTPTLVVTGPVHTTDVFAKPSVANRSLGIDLTLQNSTLQEQQITVNNKVLSLDGRATALTFPPATLTISAGKSAECSVASSFPNAKLWWPDSPVQYDIVTTITLNGRPIDQKVTKFGFREWSWQGGDFKLNGIPWHGRADLVDFGHADEDAVATWKAHGQDMERMWGEDTFSGLTPDQALDFYDSHGIVIRRTGIFDGEAARYDLAPGGQLNQELFAHWQKQLLAWAKGQRNHPSIFIWSIENEIAFINAKVYGQSEIVDPAERSVAEALEQIDPTRSVMTDGGNALLDESMPVYGCHYIEPDFDTLPEGAYDKGGLAHREIWPITQEKPIFLGESFYANGDRPGDLATVGGEAAFLGKAEERPAIGLTAKILSEGYRWNGINFHFWIGGESNEYYNSWQPVAVLCRQWDWTFGSGEKTPRTLRIFNDTHFNTPITLKWKIALGSSVFASGEHEYRVDPGSYLTVSVMMPMPLVDARTDGDWTLTLIRNGQTVFTDVKPFSVLPKLSFTHVPPASQIAVFDPSGLVQKFLSENNATFSSMISVATMPSSAKVLIIGKDALNGNPATAAALTTYASEGRCVVILEQSVPLKLAEKMSSANGIGDIGYIEDPDHPVIAGLAQSDFFTWGSESALYTNPYIKAATDGRSIIECGNHLQDSGLLELNPGSGSMLLCQLNVEGNLADSAVAQKLLTNMVVYGLNYKLVIRQTTVVAAGDPSLTDALDADHLICSKSGNVLQALNVPGQIAIINATPPNLEQLATNAAMVKSFTESGGWIILNNVTPDGIRAFDQLVGFNHIIRPFHQEKVTFPPVRNDLTLGLSPDDIIMGSGHDIFNWEAGQYPDPNAFSYVVDLDDIAPFSSSSFYGWSNITNGFTQADGFWPLITNFPAPANGQPYSIPITLPQTETITKFTFVGNNNYWPQTKIALDFGNADVMPLSYDHGDITQPAPPEDYEINPPRTTQQLTLKITGWNQIPNIGVNIGVDNIYITVKRPSDFSQHVRPMLNIGTLVEYPRGSGGIILCNVKFMPESSESNPANTAKKEAIIGTILKNLHAQFDSSNPGV